jgi:acetyl-CoA synthetase (ADP-forming)
MTRTLAEHEAKALLAEYGVTVAPERAVTTPASAVGAAVELGYPVVVKLAGPGITHKTERGLVRLGLATADAVEAAAAELLAAAHPEDGDMVLLVAPMLRGGRELIAGIHVDEQFGPCVMVGIGGVLAEAIGDVVFRLAPITEADALEMLDDLQSQPLLRPWRGEPAVDRAATAGALVGLSRLSHERPDVASVDVNPLIVVEGRPIAVDALVEVQ